MTAPWAGNPQQRAALAALDAARPLVARLDVARDPEDLAADTIEAWNVVETSLRSLIGGSALGGQALIRELRQREMLSLDTAHALLEFQAARDRVQRTDYRPTSADVAAAREGFRRLDESISGVAPPAGRASTPVVADAAPAMADATLVPSRRPVITGRGPLVTIGLAALGVIALALVGWWLTHRGGGTLAQARSEYSARRFEAAKGDFSKVAHDNPELAEPHIYLGRIAREEGDYMTANRELQSAVRLEPNNALASRELAALMLATGNAELARRFYVRSLQLDPSDKNATGFLGCSLIRLGRMDEGQRFLTRAGAGPWNACAPAAPGMQQMQPVMPVR